ncbi:MAG TPA: tetratricopeptide repeat protein, partial [Pyrinomonadaceae bacterium]|nr:tetratricopeptide repeat protein [Pyrinomonadaceae bacterium]
ERNALEHLVRLVPFDQSYAERLTALSELLGNRAPESFAPRAEPPLLRAPAQAQKIARPDEAALPVTEVQPSTQREAPAFGDLFETNSVAPEVFTTPPVPSAPPPAPASEFEFHSAAHTEAVEPHADPRASFADLNEEFADKSASAATVEPTFDFTVLHGASEDEEQEVHVTATLDAAVLPGESSNLGAPLDRSDERVQALLAQELESVDYYLAQGYTDIARDTLDMLEQQYGPSAEISARRERLQTAQEPSALKPPAATFELPVEPVLNAAPAQPALLSNTQPPPSASQSALDPGLAAVFDEFRSSIEEDTETATAADYETHYNTGLAYMEMGMIDLAIEEFQTAASLIAPQDGTPRYLQCCNLLGHCFMQQSLARAAAIWFRKGLAAPGHSEAEYQALRYELATAYEQMGDLDRAIDTFQEVYGIDVSYRGVADKLRELQAQKTVTSDK